MNVVFNLVLGLQILAAIAIIGLVLVQHGKGADMGASFGSGSSGSLFGATGSANFLSRATAVAAAVFFLSTLGLAYSTHRGVGLPEGSSVLDRAASQPAIPASGVGQIPGGAVAPSASAPASTSATTPAASAPASTASGAAAIPN